ncbi:polysaccharide biosynthesis protein [Paracoccaceae bacterium]|nr:polysaccharide biosynthesis protein [Paracoccaceae bacterium]
MQVLDKKNVLITGGTGSFGSTLVHKLLKTDVKEIRVFSRDEKKQEDMRLKYNAEKLKFYIGDVRFESSIDQAMFGVDYVFHAAALKQVPSCEFFPMEAVKTNILGADNVMSAAISNAVEKVIILSTDKAVYPINAMGLSKAMMEKLMMARAREAGERNVTLCATRYGNVMASRGSVIPLFINQIFNKQDITITDPNMTRFMMSLNDSVDLVMHAFKHAMPGDLFVQKAPAATVLQVAEALKEIFSATNKIKLIGSRHGEKLYESLLSREEMVKAESIGNFFRVPIDDRGLNYSKYFMEGSKDLSKQDDYNSHNTSRLTNAQVVEILTNLPIVRKKINA